jgi:hypothetical protein
VSVLSKEHRKAGFREVADVLKAFRDAGFTIQRYEDIYKGVSVPRYKMKVVDEASQKRLDSKFALEVVFNTMSDTAKHMLVDLGLDNPDFKITAYPGIGSENKFYVKANPVPK